MQQKQPTRITYLFGAGASIGNGKLLDEDSATGIPIVENFNRDIGIFLDRIDSFKFDTSLESAERFSKMKTTFRSIYNEFSDMYSFDTFAKSLKEKRDERKLRELKLLLKVYLMFRQELCKSDPRYDLLFATLINNGILPAHVNFLSWNYDTQIEKSLTKFATGDNEGYRQFIDLGFKMQNTLKAALLKLNGTIAARKSFEKSYHCITPINNTSEINILPLIEEMISLYSDNDQDYIYPKMYFSWEEKGRFEEVLEYSKHVISKTDILIVIGYSFPTLNRKEDMLLLKCLPDHARICIQCKDESDFKEIKSKISSLVKVNQDEVTAGENDEFYRDYPFKSVEFIPQSKEFYVPFEFDY